MKPSFGGHWLRLRFRGGIELVRTRFDTDVTPVLILIGAMVGGLVASAALAPQFILGTGGKWSGPHDDYVAYVVAWNYYLADGWRLPLFGIPAMGYPEGGNVLFNDALPLAALGSKLLDHILGLRVNPYGWWMLLAYVLQGAMAVRLVIAAGVRSLWASIAAAALAVCCWPFLWRLGHHALASHFLILWALALHFESLRRGRAKTIELTILAGMTLLVNSYLFVMIVGLGAATFLTLWRRGQFGSRDLRWAAGGVALLVALGLLSGYTVLITSPKSMRAWGYGVFSWNLADLFIPPDGLFGFLKDIPRDATTGQYEGEAYLGRGALLLLVMALLSAPREVIRLVRRHAILVSVLVAFAVYAASHRVYFGRTLLVSYTLPHPFFELTAFFRASGRFIWPLAYSLMLLPLACLFRWWPRAPAIAVALIAAVLQVTEAGPVIEHRRATTAKAYPNLLTPEPVAQWITQHRRVWQYPSWGCGGLGPPGRSWTGPETNRELQMQLTAARAAIPYNSIYMSRLLKHCDTEAEWGRHPTFEDGVLYVLGYRAIETYPELAALARSKACVTLSWGVVCSTQWLN
jgi:hypothetical protein